MTAQVAGILNLKMFFHTSVTLEVTKKYRGIRSRHPGRVSDSLVVSVGSPQDWCFSAAPHLHSWDEAAQASGTRQAAHEVSRSTPSTTANTNKTIYNSILQIFNKEISHCWRTDELVATRLLSWNQPCANFYATNMRARSVTILIGPSSQQ